MIITTIFIAVLHCSLLTFYHLKFTHKTDYFFTEHRKITDKYSIH